MLVSSHALSEVEQIADHVVIIAAGRLLRDAPLAALTAGGRDLEEVFVELTTGGLGGTVLASGLFALIGLGLGALIRNQVAAIAVAAGWLWLSEVVILATVPAAGRWVPGGALQALVQGNAGLTAVELPDLLPVWGGATLLLGYGVAFAAAATAATIRRDIT